MAGWSEIERAAEENRHELVLSGGDIAERIDRSGIDEALYKLQCLNFLEISKTTLKTLSNDCGNLTDLTNLVLFHNHLSEVPEGLGNLHKLKFMDLSHNKIESIPDSIFKLPALQSLNLCGNQISELPDISRLAMLHILNVSQNQLESLPEGICCEDLVHLAEIRANGNKLTSLPTALNQLPALKTLDISDNCISEIPSNLSECSKLKEFMFNGNKLKDRRLMKMGQQCTTKSVLDYLRGILEKEMKEAGKGKGGKKGKGKKKRAESETIACADAIKVLPFQEEGGILIKYNPDVMDVRPYIVACVVKNINLERDSSTFKRFITMQTKLHDTICHKRQAATIATHDLNSVQSPLSYEVKEPEGMMLRPLNKSKDYSAKLLVAKLNHEAEEMRKEKKRNTVTGIHKYLDLLKGKRQYPCLVDSAGVVISFPPITNCNSTKMTAQSRGLLLEVTSSTSLDVCKQVMTELLQNMLEMDLGESDDEAGAEGGKSLTVEQVKVIDPDGGLRVVFPSRVDLVSDAFSVHR